MKFTKYILVFVVIGMLFPAKLFPQENRLPLDDETQRKFDYYFYGALNAKALGNYGNAMDLLLHCHALDSTNANVLVELGTFYNVMQEKNKALEFFRKAVHYDATNYYYNMMLAGLNKEMGANEAVVEIYTFLLQQYPDKVELYFELANAYADTGELQKAIDALNELEKSTGISEMITLNKFRLYSIMDQKRKAFDEIESIIQKNPNELRYRIIMGDLYLQDNQTKKALEYYNGVKDADPDNPQLVLSMVNYYEKTNNKPAAQAELQKAITNTALEAETKIQLLTRYIAILQQNKGDIKEANPLFETLFAQHPNNTQLNFIYGNLLLMQENTADAMQQFDLFTKANPENPAGYEQMLRIAVSNEDMEKVVEITTEAIRHLPRQPQFYFYLGGAKFQMEQPREALAVFEQGLENAEFPSPLIESDFYGQIGDLNYHLGHAEVAFQKYDQALKLNPQNLPVLNNYSYYLSLMRKNLDKAEQMSGITIQAEPTNPTYLDTYGWVLFVQESYVMAKIYIERAIEYSADEPSADVYEHHGDVLFKTGDTEKAIEQWRKAKELGGGSKTLDKKIRTGKYIEEK